MSIKSRLLKSAENLKSYLIQRSDYFIPSQVILIFELIIVLFAFTASYTLRYNFQVPEIVVHRMYAQIIPLAVFSALVFLFTGVHKSVIRYTGIKDVIRVVKAMFIITVWMLLMYIINTYKPNNEVLHTPRAVIIIFFILSTTIIIFTRSAIRLFYYWLMAGNEVTRVLIYGAGSAGIITKNALIADHARPTKVAGFIDNNPKKIGKTIEGVYVYSDGVLNPAFIRNNRIDEIIFSIQNIDKDRKRYLIETLLAQTNLQVKEIPPLDMWINGQLSTKQINPVKITDLLQRSEIHLNTDHVRTQVQDKHVMVTGAAGSIGSEIVRQLLKFNPTKLILVDQAETPMFNLENELKKLLPRDIDTEFIIGDITDCRLMENVFADHRPHIVYHAAAYKHVPLMENNPFEAVRVNIFGTKNIADLAVKFKVARFVMISTDKAVNPTNVMGATKRAAEIYIQSLNNKNELSGNNSDFRTRFITTRFGNVLGSNGSVIPLFEKQIAAGGPVTVTHPEITRHFMTIPEACRLVLEAGAFGKGGEILMFDMGKPVKIADLAYNMIRLSGMEPGRDIKIVFTGLRPGEKLYEELLYDSEKGFSTHHPKIFVGKQKAYSYAEVIDYLNMLSNIINARGLSKSNINGYDIFMSANMQLISILKKFIPEYISNNSVYKELDKQA